MRILITSYVFHPVFGGITTAASLLAHQFSAAGHKVTLVTKSRGADPADLNYRVIRRPGPIALWREVAASDVVLSVHLSLRLAWPVLLQRRAWVIAHHSWLTKVNGAIGWVERVKRFLLRRAVCISVSQAVADHVQTPSVVIGPPYDETTFWCDDAINRKQELLFVGRLVSSKGVDVLLNALALLRANGRAPQLTIVGDGPELSGATQLAQRLGIEGQVEFVGPRAGAELRQTYCAHRILVVPSVTRETFGIVALEGIACGCVVIGSDEAGGLTDAIGPCGVRVEMRDAEKLAHCLEDFLAEPERLAGYRAEAGPHAQRFTAPRVAEQYLEIIHSSVGTAQVPARFLASLAPWHFFF